LKWQLTLKRKKKFDSGIWTVETIIAFSSNTFYRKFKEPKEKLKIGEQDIKNNISS